MFAAGVARKGEENIFPDLIRQVDHLIVLRLGEVTPFRDFDAKGESVEATAAFEAEFSAEVTRGEELRSIGFKLEIVVEGATFLYFASIGQGEESRLGLSLKVHPIARNGAGIEAKG